MEEAGKMIYTFNARNNVMWDAVKRFFNLRPEQMLRTIAGEYNYLVAMLEQKGISYEELHTVLSPVHRGDRQEMILCFDSGIMEEAQYENHVFRELLPFLNRERDHIIFDGDYMVPGLNDYDAYSILFDSIHKVNETRYQCASQYFMVYLTNLAESEVQTLVSGLARLPWFVGYADMTFAGLLKDMAAFCLTQWGIQKKNRILMSKEEHGGYITVRRDVSFLREFGYEEVCVDAMYYMTFLEYKIESRMAEKSDLLYSLNTISGGPGDIREFEVTLTEDSLCGIREKNQVLLTQTGLWDQNRETLGTILKGRLPECNIYNLELKDCQLERFQTCMEFENQDGKREKLLVSFGYEAEGKELRVLDLF